MGGLRLFPGADAVLAAGTELPQPDQLCGPFSAVRALHAIREAVVVPTVVDLARASGTRVWPHDVASWRPAGAPLDRRDWEALPPAPGEDAGGTDARGLAGGLAATTDVAVVPARDLSGVALGRLLAALTDLEHPVGVLANVRTGPIAPPGTTWDVGHFVVLLGLDDDPVDGGVLLADTYAELGAEGWPSGCRTVTVDDLARALPDRGLLLLLAPAAAHSVAGLVRACGADPTLWAT